MGKRLLLLFDKLLLQTAHNTFVVELEKVNDLSTDWRRRRAVVTWRGLGLSKADLVVEKLLDAFGVFGGELQEEASFLCCISILRSSRLSL